MTAWINTISAQHVARGVAGGFTQADHGKPDRLQRLAQGDWIAFYSPKTDYPDGEPLRMFTALGQVVDDQPYQVELASGATPFRRRVEFVECTPVPIRPLIEHLEFIEDKQHWGFRFRFGLFRVNNHDFDVIRSALTRRAAA
ncbi:EVE domain-containing protein [Mycobacterium sp. MS1601]|uniref:EVE domain-containing protein n=1 Tax=Mycobacterium sp. MS1601 TaxID=1936029 RepID=UPI0009795C7F|nr:EVE domain-containing protein [Mycobacterium sp. MS1601]AQA02952.1 EVE domain-containing protein [Mycobacterium sp. MS1601]